MERATEVDDDGIGANRKLRRERRLVVEVASDRRREGKAVHLKIWVS